jgi:dihydroflavonol-4-reductase
MKALVTGASGFIGSTLIEELDTLGFEVRALMRTRSSLRSSTSLEGLKFECIDGNLSDFSALCKAVKGVNYIFHLAGVSSATNRAGFFEQNTRVTERLARAVAAVGPDLTRLVFVSSLAAAGPSETLRPRVETDEDKPVSNFGESKLRGEKALLNFKDLFPVTIVRPPFVYGPKDKVLFKMIQTVARNFMPVLYGAGLDGHKYYSAIHSKDLCRGLVQAAVASIQKVPSGEVFYLAADGVHTYSDLMTTIAEGLNSDPLKINVPNFVIKATAGALSAVGFMTRRTFPLNLDKLKELLPDYWICSNQKAKTMLGFVPEFDFTSGMANSIAWYKKQRWL